MSYYVIRNSHDIASFINTTNGLHDGYLVSAHYEHTGFEWGNPLYVDEQKAVLELRIMVTSRNNTLIELVFDAVREWQIKENQDEMLDTSISFTDDGLILWRSDDDYVISKSMKWRMVSDTE